MKRKSLFALVAAVLSLAIFSPRAAAVIEVLNLDFVFTGVAPGGTSPWLTATLQDGLAPNTVRLTLDAAHLTGTEFVSEWYFNLNPLLDPSQLSFALVTTPPTDFTTANIHTGVDAFQADGDGKYDIQLDFPPPPGSFSAKFTSGEQVILDVSRASGLTVNDLLFLSAPGGGNGSFYSAAHIQGIGPSGSDSSWVGSGAFAAPLPEPASYAFALGAAVVVLVLVRELKSRRQAI